MAADRLGDLSADGVDRVQGEQRLLEDHRDVAAAEIGELAPGRAPARPGRPPRICALDPAAALREQAQDRAQVTLLPEPDLADERHRLPALQDQVDAVDAPAPCRRRRGGSSSATAGSAGGIGALMPRAPVPGAAEWPEPGCRARQATRWSGWIAIERRLLLAADRLPRRRSGDGSGSRGRVDRVRRIPRQQRGLACGCRDPATASRRAAPRYRGGPDASSTVPAGADLGDPAEIHHHHPVGDEAHDVQVVADEDVGQAELGLEVEEQVQDLRLHRLVQRRNRLVEEHQPRLQGERAGDVDPLALPAGDLVRIAPGEALRLQADPGEQTRARAPRPPGRARRCTFGPKAMTVSTVMPRVEGRVAVLEHHLDLPAVGPPGHRRARRRSAPSIEHRRRDRARSGPSAAWRSWTCRSRISPTMPSVSPFRTRSRRRRRRAPPASCRRPCGPGSA